MSLPGPPMNCQLIESNAIKSIQQIRALEILMENESVPVSDLTMIAGVSGSVLKTLEKKAILNISK